MWSNGTILPSDLIINWRKGRLRYLIAKSLISFLPNGGRLGPNGSGIINCNVIFFYKKGISDTKNKNGKLNKLISQFIKVLV